MIRNSALYRFEVGDYESMFLFTRYLASSVSSERLTKIALLQNASGDEYQLGLLKRMRLQVSWSEGRARTLTDWADLSLKESLTMYFLSEISSGTSSPPIPKAQFDSHLLRGRRFPSRQVSVAGWLLL